MQIFKEIEPLKAFLHQKKVQKQSVGLVPTMGALHAGHLLLLATAKAENTVTICSIYVNPTQFNNLSDLEKYPRTIEKDIALLEGAGCDALFCPDNTEMYREASTLTLDFGALGKVLEGEFRPGHFSGVALVVSKLFNIVEPDNAYFGQKDFQQFSVISRLVEELKFGLQLHCVDTLREKDGLAMSSRNLRLNANDRAKAIVFYQSLLQARAAIARGHNLTEVKARVTQQCTAVEGVRLEYFEVANKENLILLDSVTHPDQSIMLIAGYVGEVRLIDNLTVLEK
jgi:pantoate--beta-alanine ligase